MFPAFRTFRTGRRAIGGAMLAISLVAFLSSNQFAALKLAFNFWDPFAITQYRLSQFSDEEYRTAIEQALDEEDIVTLQFSVGDLGEIPEDVLRGRWTHDADGGPCSRALSVGEPIATSIASVRPYMHAAPDGE